eukprot:GEZU01043047.1.p1 GENE.GEZU01043047.1~~GEZU01043047.1.p1  ORF type:complete len:133 (-),score=18.30 GEZU01043047.1:183-581(-)
MAVQSLAPISPRSSQHGLFDGVLDRCHVGSLGGIELQAAHHDVDVPRGAIRVKRVLELLVELGIRAAQYAVVFVAQILNVRKNAGIFDGVGGPEEHVKAPNVCFEQVEADGSRLGVGGLDNLESLLFSEQLR